LQARYGISSCGIDGPSIIRVQLVSFSKPPYRTLDVRYLGHGVLSLALGKLRFRVSQLGEQVLLVVLVSEVRRGDGTLEGIQLQLTSRLCISR